MSFLPREFRPARWAPGPHLQTLGARVLRPSENPFVRSERLPTPDDDFLDLEWTAEPTPGAPIVLVLHGLEGSAQRRYMRNVCRELVQAGVWAVAMNFRGCSGEPNRKPHYYHSGKTDDPDFVLRTLRERYPERRFGALGFSLGGNVLLKLLGERADGGRGLVDAAVVVSVPYDLAAGCALLERTRMGRFYASYFLRSLQSKLH
ncbi:MAG: alpha/beta hydrolase, partial [Gemmatimonadota bacterium]